MIHSKEPQSNLKQLSCFVLTTKVKNNCVSVPYAMRIRQQDFLSIKQRILDPNDKNSNFLFQPQSLLPRETLW
jgi:hypothetical protein